MTTRRAFLRNSLVAVGATLLAPAVAQAKPAEVAPPPALPAPPAPPAPPPAAVVPDPELERIHRLICWRQMGIISQETALRELRREYGLPYISAPS